MVNENPLYRRASYVLSAHRLQQLPDDQGREVAFAGRSNAGKSSAINAITNQKSLARTSKTPGRTQQIVVFDLDGDRRLMDLPGYGYAKVGKSMRAHWDQMLDQYFRSRQSLCGLVLIMDIRHPLRDFDLQMLNWCQAAQLPCHLLLTKADKLKRGPANNTRLKVEKTLREMQLEASVQTFSATKRMGIAEAHSVLDSWLDD